MPKRVKEINPFHGGINNKDDQRDINETQLVEALNVKADSKGTLKVIGNLVQGGTAWTNSANSTSNVQPGFGLFRFSSDADASGNSGTDSNNTDYLIAWSETTEKFYWWNGTSWAEILNVSSAWSGNGKKPVFSYANGNLRVCDSNFDNATNENHWLGYIKRHIFKGSNSASNIAQWYSTPSSLTKPGSSTPGIKTAVIGSDSDTAADYISWVIGDCRLNTTEIHQYSLGDNDSDYTVSNAVAQNRLFEHPYLSSSNRILDLGFSNNLTGDNVFSGTSSARLSTSNGTYFDTAFNISTTGSVYITVKFRDQGAFDAFNGGYAVSSETTATFRNFKFKLYNSASSTTNYISWNVSAEDLSRNGVNDWHVLEFAYDEADENNLSGTAINQYAFEWDTTISKSGSDDFTSTVYALTVADMRTGDSEQTGNDLLGNRKLAYSYTYDDKKSESLLTDIETFNFGNNRYGYSKFIQAGARSITNKRVTGAVLYAYEDDEDPYMITELDFVKGIRGSWETEWPGTADSTSQWTSVGSNSVKSGGIYNDIIPLIETYAARNGYSHKQDSIDARYKSIVITNNRAYIGNVRIDGVNYPDRMIKSQAFDYDAFPEEGRSIEVVQQDGDSIVTLAAYADRLFQYKKNKLHVINITSEQEFLEDSHTGLGVKYPYHVVEMSTGIAWFNENGAYYFDGKQINNITNGLIDDEDWKDHVALAGAKAQIFYVPRQDKLIIVGGKNSSNELGRDFYEYTIYTGGWTRGEDILENTNYSNFVLDVDETVKTFKPSDGRFYTWSDTATTTRNKYQVITGDLIFDSSAVRKKIYSVHVTHKGLGAAKSLKCYGRADRAGTWTDLGQLNNYSDFTVQEFDVSGVNNARSFQVKIEYYDSDSGSGMSQVPIDFEINDINIVYRSKNVR